MADPVTELHLRDYLDIARRRRWLVAFVILGALAVAIVLSALQTPKYRAEARVRVEPVSSDGETPTISGSARDRNLQNEVDFARSDRVRSRAFDILGDPAARFSVNTSSGSDTLIFRADSVEPATAALIANTFADAYVAERSEFSIEQFFEREAIINDRLTEIEIERSELQARLDLTPDDRTLQSQIASLDGEEVRRRASLTDLSILLQVSQSSATVAILNAAVPPRSPFEPSWPRNIALALVAGSILGVGAALLRETLDDTILSKRDIENAADGAPVVGVIPPPTKTRRKLEWQLVTSRTGAFTEGFRTLRSAIELGQATGGDLNSLLVTSANAAEGKSTVVAHLAISLARAGDNVLVIDADMHNPTQHIFFGVPNEHGLAEHLSNTSEAEIVVETVTGDALVSLIPAGTSTSPPAELLSSLMAQEFILKLSAAYDIVLIDSPPLRPVSDTLPLARIADTTLVVAMQGKTTQRELEQALQLLDRAQVVPFGIVLSGANQSDVGYGYGYSKKR